MAEAPAASFTRVEASKPMGMVEKVRSIRLPEEKRAQREAKAREKELRAGIPKATIDSLKQERNKRGLGLNIQEDPRFKEMVKDQEDSMLQNPSLATELGGGILGPSQKAEAMSLAYAKFSTLHPDTAKQYARDGIHVTGPDKKGSYRIDTGADPFWRATQDQARVLRARGDLDGAKRVVDDFVRSNPSKAELYGANGVKELQKAREGLASEAPTQPQAPEAPKTVTATTVLIESINSKSSTEQQVTAIQELTKKVESRTATFREQNQLKELMNANKQHIAEARELKRRLEDPNEPPLADADLKKLEEYAPLLTAIEAVPAAPTVAVETTAQKTAREAAEYQATRGAQSMQELQGLGVDFTKSEKEAMEALKSKNWTEDAETLKYIHAGFAEHQRLQAEAVVDKLPAETTNALVKKGMDKKDILELILGLIAAGIVSVGQDALTSTAAKAGT